MFQHGVDVSHMLLGSLLHLTQGGSPVDQQGLHWGWQTHPPHSCHCLCCHQPARRDMSALVDLILVCVSLQLACKVQFVCSVATQQHSETDPMGFRSCQAMWGGHGGGVGQKGGKGLVCGQLIAQWFNRIARVSLYPVLGLMQSCGVKRLGIGYRIHTTSGKTPVRPTFLIR